MATLQNDIEKIIQNNIHKMAGQKLQKRSLHIAHQYNELLGELYDNDLDAVAFINHFGHIEYRNNAFIKMMMLDKHDKSFDNIYNMEKLPISFELIDNVLHITYPNNRVIHMTLNNQLVQFQKSVLLQLTFKDISAIYVAQTSLKDCQKLSKHYLNNLLSPMFLINQEGHIVHAPNGDLKLFGKNMKQFSDASIFEVLPFDYAKELMDKTKIITSKVDGHFMYQIESDKIITVYDTTVRKLDDTLYLCQLMDVSDLNTMSSTIEYLNSYDSLTGFYNVNYFENLLTTLNNSGHLPMGIYTLSLQGLKQVNTRLGYHQCDNLLIEIALNIKSIISQHEIPCRITGDTFIVFFPNCSQSTMTKFDTKMDAFIDSYKAKYVHYYLTYAAKSILLNDHSTDLSALLSGMII